MKFEETKTYENLQKALTGEATAHLKYQFYQKQLSEFNKGYDNILNEIIHNEKEHGKIWFKILHNNTIPDNETNLLDAITGETYEANEMYIGFGKIAEEEGYKDIADLFNKVASIEKHHSQIFHKIKTEISTDIYDSIEQTDWKCLNCGYRVTGFNAPNNCPVCKHPQKYFTKEEK